MNAPSCIKLREVVVVVSQCWSSTDTGLVWTRHVAGGRRSSWHNVEFGLSIFLRIEHGMAVAVIQNDQERQPRARSSRNPVSLTDQTSTQTSGSSFFGAGPAPSLSLVRPLLRHSRDRAPSRVLSPNRAWRSFLNAETSAHQRVGCQDYYIPHPAGRAASKNVLRNTREPLKTTPGHNGVSFCLSYYGVYSKL